MDSKKSKMDQISNRFISAAAATDFLTSNASDHLSPPIELTLKTLILYFSEEEDILKRIWKLKVVLIRIINMSKLWL